MFRYIFVGSAFLKNSLQYNLQKEDAYIPKRFKEFWWVVKYG